MSSLSSLTMHSDAPPPSDTTLQNCSFDGDFFFASVSPAMAKVHARIERLSSFSVPVLILGESGVGKEVAARRIHKLSARAHRPFLKVNCAALPADLLESELFGFEAGAFTGATKSKPGYFELSHRGTILLDEIGEIPATLQAKLLHVLQDRQFSRLGGRSQVTVDVRVLAATNVNIEQALQTGKFREDLYFRLSAFTIHVPPLRERRDEISPLLHFLMDRFASRLSRPPKAFSPDVVNACLRYSWPGNVRELENFVKRYLILDDDEALLSELQQMDGSGHGLMEAFSRPRLDHCPDLKSLVRSLKAEAEAEAIKLALAQAKGSRKEAARLLKISTKALLYKLREYGIPGVPENTLPESN